MGNQKDSGISRQDYSADAPPIVLALRSHPGLAVRSRVIESGNKQQIGDAVVRSHAKVDLLDVGA
jgi:hypothetical protein